jgi:gamma-glutamyl:cysteine ligase YbdK (ATP-grasp superfamily)
VTQPDFVAQQRTEGSIRDLHEVHTEVAYAVAAQVEYDHAERLERCAADLPERPLELRAVVDALQASLRTLRWAEETLGVLVADLRADARAREHSPT